MTLQVDRDRERGVVQRGVVRHHRGDVQLIEPLAGHGQADQSPPVGRHEVDGLGGDQLRRHRQVAFVFPVLIVNHDDHASGP